VWIYTGNKMAKFYGNILSLIENIAKSFRGGYFFDSHCRQVSLNVPTLPRVPMTDTFITPNDKF